MRKTDSRRLIKALFMSIVLHIILFIGLNFFNWFSETIQVKKYEPLSVKIESRPVIEKESNDIKADVSESLPESSLVEAPEVESVISSSAPVAAPVAALETEIDEYADPSSWFSSTDSISEPEPSELGVREVPYIPLGGNKVELDNSVPDKIDSNPQTINTQSGNSGNGVDSILSEDDISGLERALESDQKSIDNSSSQEADSTKYRYNDYPVQFDNPNIGRSLISEPSINIPSKFSNLLSSESTVVVGFYLNEDGRLYYLKIKQSSGYSDIDNSIISELRKWEFDKASGSVDVQGIITILLKGK